jgi:hypothetical protein
MDAHTILELLDIPLPFVTPNDGDNPIAFDAGLMKN